MAKTKIRELLALEPGKCYIMKYVAGSISDSAGGAITEFCKTHNIDILGIPIYGSIDQVSFETKTNSKTE